MSVEPKFIQIHNKEDLTPITVTRNPDGTRTVRPAMATQPPPCHLCQQVTHERLVPASYTVTSPQEGTQVKNVLLCWACVRRCHEIEMVHKYRKARPKAPTLPDTSCVTC